MQGTSIVLKHDKVQLCTKSLEIKVVTISYYRPPGKSSKLFPSKISHHITSFFETSSKPRAIYTSNAIRDCQLPALRKTQHPSSKYLAPIVLSDVIHGKKYRPVMGGDTLCPPLQCLLSCSDLATTPVEYFSAVDQEGKRGVQSWPVCLQVPFAFVTAQDGGGQKVRECVP